MTFEIKEKSKTCSKTLQNAKTLGQIIIWRKISLAFAKEPIKNDINAKYKSQKSKFNFPKCTICHIYLLNHGFRGGGDGVKPHRILVFKYFCKDRINTPQSNCCIIRSSSRNFWSNVIIPKMQSTQNV